MKKYKLINTKTNETHLCDKVTIDGFEYYVSDEQLEINDYCYRLTTNQLYIISEHAWSGSNNILLSYAKKYCKKVIATNNPNTDIPKVVDEVDNIGYKWFVTANKKDTIFDLGWLNIFKGGYNKSQETHPFSEQDMIEFVEWVIFNYPNQWKSVRTLNTKGFYSTKELFQLWEEQRTKIIHYDK